MSTTLREARVNASKLICFIYLQNIFWIVVSKINLKYTGATISYKVSDLEMLPFSFFVFYAVFFSLVACLFAFCIKPVRLIVVSKWAVYFWLMLGVVANIVYMLNVSDAARYTSGGLTGVNGIIYVLSRSLTWSGMILAIRLKHNNFNNFNYIIYALVGTFAATIDGFGNALLIITFAILYYISDFRVASLVKTAPVIVALTIGIGIFAAEVKFTGSLNVLDPSIAFPLVYNWIIPRFAIQAESMLAFVSGDLAIGGGIDTVKLIAKSVSDRIGLLTGNLTTFTYPRSVSESIYGSLHGQYDGSGSSPGLFLGTAMFGIGLFWIIPLILAFIFVQMFYRLPIKLNLLNLCAFSYFTRGLHADSSEYFTVVSFVAVYMVVFYIGCILYPKSKRFESVAT